MIRDYRFVAIGGIINAITTIGVVGIGKSAFIVEHLPGIAEMFRSIFIYAFGISLIGIFMIIYGIFGRIKMSLILTSLVGIFVYVIFYI